MNEPKLPDELWGIWDTETKRVPMSVYLASGLEAMEVFQSEGDAKQGSEQRGRHSDREFEPVLIGVNPAIRDERDALRAEVDRLKRQHDKAISIAVDTMIGRYCESKHGDLTFAQFIEAGGDKCPLCAQARIAELEADNARLRGDGPIAVGDVVQVTDPDYTIQTLIVVHLTHDDQLGVWGHNGTDKLVWKPNRVLARVGRAVRMPDGTPVEPAS